VFSVGQVAAVSAAFSLAGFGGDLRTLPVDSEDERLFVVPADAISSMGDLRSLEQVLTQLLRAKVWVLSDVGNETVPFG
jgi:hypothetical protein